MRSAMAYAACCLLFAGGCGYSLGYRAPPHVQSVAVPIFQNQSFPLFRDIEYELTDTFRREIQARTPLEVLTSGSADLLILGTIRDFRKSTVAEDEHDRAIESVLVVVVSVTVEDFRNRRRWTEDVRVVEPFSIQLGDTTASVRERAFKNLSERMLLAIESWE